MSNAGRRIRLKFRRHMGDPAHSDRDPDDLAREFEPTGQSIRAWVGEHDDLWGFRLTR